MKIVEELDMKKVFDNTRVLCDGMKGQNYWFNGCMEYLMECLGESKDYNYWFFSDVTGDSLTQLYSKNINEMALCFSRNAFNNTLAKSAFDACGYEVEYISNIAEEDRNLYISKIKSYIDKGIPVIAHGGFGVWDSYGENGWEWYCICGYDNDELYYLTCDKSEPKNLPTAFTDLILVGDKKETPTLADVYKKTVMDIPSYILRPSTSEYSFGKQAFIDWAESFQNNTFTNIPAEDINTWNVHGTYLCMAGTNGCAFNCLENALKLNPEMTFINELFPLYKKHSEVFHILAYRDANNQNDYQNGGIHGGFNIKPETIKSKKLMEPINRQIMKSAKICDEIIAIFEKHNLVV